MEKKYLVTQNIVYNFLGQIILLALGVITTPFIIHSLGNDLYGIYSIVTVIVGYFAILDLGLGQSLIKYISEYSAKEDKVGLEKIIGTALTAYIVVGLLGGLLILLFAKLIVWQFLHIPTSLMSVALTVFYLSGLGFFVTMVLTVFNAIPNGLQRMDVTNSRNIIFGLLNSIGIITLLIWGQGLIAIVLWNVLVSIVATVVFIKVIAHLLPTVSLKPKYDHQIMKKLLSFGGFKFISNIAGQVIFQVDRFLIGIFYPIALVTFYASPLLLVQKGFSAMLNITNAVFPAISYSQSLGDHTRIKELYFRMTRLILSLMLPILGLLIIFSDQIIKFWLGVEFVDQSAPVLRVLALSYIFSALSAAPVIVAEGVGQVKITAVFGVIGALVNLVAALVLIPVLGIKGAAYALLINSAILVPIMVIVVNKTVVRVSNWELFKRSYLKIFLATLLSSVVALIFSHLEKNSLVSLIYGFLSFAPVYILTNLGLKTFDQKDIMAAEYIINKVKVKIKPE